MNYASVISDSEHYGKRSDRDTGADHDGRPDGIGFHGKKYAGDDQRQYDQQYYNAQNISSLLKIIKIACRDFSQTGNFNIIFIEYPYKRFSYYV